MKKLDTPNQFQQMRAQIRAISQRLEKTWDTDPDNRSLVRQLQAKRERLEARLDEMRNGSAVT